MQVPSFKTEKIRDDVFKLVDMAPTRGMYAIVMKSVDVAMNELISIRDELAPKNDEAKEMLKKWDKSFSSFGEREAYYYKAFLESEDRSFVDDALFRGEYGNFNFETEAKWPDIETPWRLANTLSTIAVTSGKDQAFLDDLERRFKNIITSFWDEANQLIIEEQQKFIAMAEAEKSAKTESRINEGRIYGFWPVVAVGAVALVGLFGAAAGYTASQKSEPDEYVQTAPAEKHLKTAKTVGLGIAIGVILAMLFMLRIRR